MDFIFTTDATCCMVTWSRRLCRNLENQAGMSSVREPQTWTRDGRAAVPYHMTKTRERMVTRTTTENKTSTMTRPRLLSLSRSSAEREKKEPEASAANRHVTSTDLRSACVATRTFLQNVVKRRTCLYICRYTNRPLAAARQACRVDACF